MSVTIQDKDLYPAVQWIWSLFKQYYGTSEELLPDITIGTSTGTDIRISDKFVKIIKSGGYNTRELFDDKPVMVGSDGSEDLLGTAFYLVNCLQEYGPLAKCSDQYGRFMPEYSLQGKYGLHKRNFAGECFDKLAAVTPKLSHIKRPDKPSRILLTHDIDLIPHGLLEDGKALLMRGRFDLLFLLLVRHVLSGPSWADLDKIMDIHDEYGMKSVFFWLVEQGKSKSPFTGATIENSDYEFNSARLKAQRDRIQKRGFENGLHKSAGNFPFLQEMSRFENKTAYNRNHYLLYRLPDHYDLVEEAGLKVDCTVGFAGSYGFRNSYSQPFMPFNMQQRRPYRFLEVPVNLMDTTFKTYLGESPENTRKLITDFLDRHRTNSVLSLIWHNNMFFKYKNGEWLVQYKLILDYLRHNGIRSVLLKDLYDEYFKEV
jgi:hypothetical protein